MPLFRSMQFFPMSHVARLTAPVSGMILRSEALRVNLFFPGLDIR
jgi:hypothetical protein